MRAALSLGAIVCAAAIIADPVLAQDPPAGRRTGADQRPRFVGDPTEVRNLIGLVDVPPEAIIIVNAMLRPALIVCKDRVGEEVPKDWAAALKGKEPILADILRSVGLISCQNVLRPGTTVQNYYPAPVGTGFVVAPGVVMTNRHVALEFAEAGGAFRAIPDG